MRILNSLVLTSLCRSLVPVHSWFYGNNFTKYNDNYGMLIHHPPKYSFEDTYVCDTTHAAADIFLVVNPRWSGPWLQDWVKNFFEPSARSLFQKVRIATGFVAGINYTDASGGSLGSCGNVISDFHEWDQYDTPNSDMNNILTASSGFQKGEDEDSYAYEYLLNSWQLAWSGNSSVASLSWDEKIDMTAHPSYFRLVLVLTSGSATWTSLSEAGSYKPDFGWMIPEPIFHRPIACGETPLDVMQMRLSSTIYSHQANFMVYNMDDLPRWTCNGRDSQADGKQSFCTPETASFRMLKRWMKSWMPGDPVFLTVSRDPNYASESLTALKSGLMHSFCSSIQTNSDEYHDYNGGDSNNTNTDGGGGGGGGSGGEDGDDPSGGGGGGGNVPDNGDNPSQNDDGGNVIPYPVGSTTAAPDDDKDVPWWWWLLFVFTGLLFSGLIGLGWWRLNRCHCFSCSEFGRILLNDIKWCCCCGCCKDNDLSEIGEFGLDGDFEVESGQHIDLAPEELHLVEGGRMDVEGFLE